MITTIKGVRRRHSRDEILDGALATAVADGFSRLTYGRVAKHLGINDRVVVYYFPTKDDLVEAVLSSLGTELQRTLADALEASDDHLAVVRRAWPVLARPEADRVFALFFEANGLAAAGRPPFDAVVPQLVEAWIEWVGSFLPGRPDRRRAEAEAAIAVIDGLLLLRQLGGPEAADRAARRLGVT